MDTPDHIRIPLRKRNGDVVAHALISAEDQHLAALRWYLNSDGSVVRSIGYQRRKRIVRLHREIMGLVPGDGLEVDHKNRNQLDNRRSNLRISTRAQNQQNVGANRGSTSKHRGVSWSSTRNKWVAHAQVNGRCHYLGLFVDEERAAAKASEFRAEHMPFAVEGTEQEGLAA